MRVLFIVFVILFSGIELASAQHNEDCNQYDKAGMELYYNKQYKEALVYMEELVACNPSTRNFYNTACIASLAGNKKRGFFHLERAVSNGYLDSLHMVHDTDLEYLRSLKEWKQVSVWMAEYRTKIYSEISKIHGTCPASDLIPYSDGEKWGYLDKKTKHKITEPVFGCTSFVGQTGRVGYGYENEEREILFNCSGQVISDKQIPRGIMAAEEEYYSVNVELSKGFAIQHNEITEIAPGYPDFYGISVNDGHLFAIVQAAASGMYSLIDSTGNSVFGIEKYKWLGYYNYGNDSKYFKDNDLYNDFFIFYIDSIGNVGFFSKGNFEKNMWPGINNYKTTYGSSFDKESLYQARNYIYLKKNDKWGIWNCTTMQWIVEPEYDEIFYTSRTFDGHYENKYNAGSIIDLYFCVKQNGREFFIDKENVKYIPE